MDVWMLNDTCTNRPSQNYTYVAIATQDSYMYVVKIYNATEQLHL